MSKPVTTSVRAALATIDPAAAFPAALRLVAESLAAGYAQIWLPGDHGNGLHLLTGAPSNPRFRDFERASGLVKMEKGDGLPGAAWASQERVWLSRVADDPTPGRFEGLPRGDWQALAIPSFLGNTLLGVTEFILPQGVVLTEALLSQAQDALFSLMLSIRAAASGQSAERLRRLYSVSTEDATETTIVFQDDGTVTDATSALQALGFPTSLRGSNLFDIVATSDRDAVRNLITTPIPENGAEVAFKAVHANGLIREMTGRVRDLTKNNVVNGYVLTVKDSTDESSVQRHLAHDARHDPLTGLLNRPTVLHEISALLQRGDVDDVAILFVDLDGFKNVNTIHGHPAADGVLRQVAHRLRRSVGEQDLVARLGGDEFLVVLTDMATSVAAEDVARRLVKAMRRPFPVESADVTIGASVGIVLPRHGNDWTADLIVWSADVAMYEAKRLKSGVMLFTPSLADQVRDRKRLEHELLDVVRSGNLEMAFQPIMALPDCTIAGAEALIRWNHPDRGVIPPSKFIPIAEQTGAIREIGRWALNQAVGQMARWRQEMGKDGPSFISVNVAAPQLAETSFPDDVVAILNAHRLPASCLSLEITESALLSDGGNVNTVIDRLQSHGITLDIDDFGTGYSSWAYLARLPIHALKIDKSFTWGLGADQRLTTTVEALIGLARQLGLRTIVEGVEKEEHLTWLREHGADYAQGYLISKPVTPIEFENVVAENRRQARPTFLDLPPTQQGGLLRNTSMTPQDPDPAVDTELKGIS